MPTPHNAAMPADIADVVIMPGDPLRAQFVAEHYLDDYRLVSDVRNMYCFTGTYKGVPLSVMGSGMGIPSMSIYAHELYHDYDVSTIIRIGTAGGLAPQVKLRNVVMGQAACTDSNFALHYGMPGAIAPICDFGLLRSAANAAEQLGVSYHVGNLLTTDVFYSQDNVNEKWAQMGVLAVEMEAAGLYLNAMEAGKKVLAIATVSDLPLTGESLSAEDRQTTFTEMMEIALAVALEESQKE